MQLVHDVPGEQIGFSRETKPSAEQIDLAISALTSARFHLLHQLREAERRRYRRKIVRDRTKVPPPFSPQQAIETLRRLAVGRRAK